MACHGRPRCHRCRRSISVSYWSKCVAVHGRLSGPSSIRHSWLDVVKTIDELLSPQDPVFLCSSTSGLAHLVFQLQSNYLIQFQSTSTSAPVPVYFILGPSPLKFLFCKDSSLLAFLFCKDSSSLGLLFCKDSSSLRFPFCKDSSSLGRISLLQGLIFIGTSLLQGLIFIGTSLLQGFIFIGIFILKAHLHWDFPSARTHLHSLLIHFNGS